MKVWVLRAALLPFFLLRDIWRRWGGTGQRVQPLRMAPWHGGPVAILALYQSGSIRPDVLALILALRRQGVYVLAVNTGELADRGHRLPVDGYVERRNFGRDFGSYRVGIRLVQRFVATPPRLILLNDSVFYAAAGLDAFVTRLVASRADLCSATESSEVAPHHQSFCLSFSPACQEHSKFLGFWDRYVPTDLRPATVLLGEIALSRRLRGAGLSVDVLAGHEAVRRHVIDHPASVSGPSGTEAGSLADWSISGNVSHRAPLALLDLGVPAVKLDLLKRTSFRRAEFAGLGARLNDDERTRLADLVSRSKSSGILDRLGGECGLS